MIIIKYYCYMAVTTGSSHVQCPVLQLLFRGIIIRVDNPLQESWLSLALIQETHYKAVFRSHIEDRLGTKHEDVICLAVVMFKSMSSPALLYAYTKCMLCLGLIFKPTA